MATSGKPWYFLRKSLIFVFFWYASAFWRLEIVRIWMFLNLNSANCFLIHDDDDGDDEDDGNDEDSGADENGGDDGCTWVNLSLTPPQLPHSWAWLPHEWI